MTAPPAPASPSTPAAFAAAQIHAILARHLDADCQALHKVFWRAKDAAFHCGARPRTAFRDLFPKQFEFSGVPFPGVQQDPAATKKPMFS
jgi:hypothetical protein